MIKIFKHNGIYIYLISLLLNMNFINFFNIEINNKILYVIINELLIIDLIILLFFIIFFKETLYKIKEISSLLISKYFYLIFLVGFLGISISIFNSVDKNNNSFFIFLYYLNTIKVFIGLIIFLVLVEKNNFNLIKNFYLYFCLILIFLIIINFIIYGHISRFYYPFTNKTNGYNLIGLVSGILFFSTLNFHFKNNSISILSSFTLLLFFLIIFFCFSKTSIFSFLITFILYYLVLNKNITKKIILLSLILIIILILSLDIIKYFFETNTLSFTDIILNPFTWVTKYGSFYYRIEHVWLSNIDKNLNLLIFLFGEGIYSPKTHDSLYFTIISRFGFFGLVIFLLMIFDIFSKSKLKTHSTLTFCLIFSLTSEMVLQSNIINPLVIILLYINFSKKIILN